MYKLTTLFVSILFVLILSTANAATYYVDDDGGNNSNSGTSPSSAWKTVSKVNAVTFKAGDVVLFKSGGHWREQLNIKSPGTSSMPIVFGSYESGEKPIISGADLLTGFVLHSGNIWKKSVSLPQQVFFNNIRGKEKSSISGLVSARDWYYDSGAKVLYVHSSGNPATSYTAPGIEAAVRYYTIYVNTKFITIKDLQVEKTSHNGIALTTNTEGITVDNLTFYQWTNQENSSRAGISIQGKNNTVKNCTFGKNTGNDIADQNWVGYSSILMAGTNIEVHDNKIYHSSTENESGNGAYAYAIRLLTSAGITKIYKNYIYHPGSHGISVAANTKSGDLTYIYENRIEYPGQAGISAYKTRSNDGAGGKGYIYNNYITYANRLGGDVGGGGTQASGIHFNDGVRAGTDPNKPFMKWYCYENIIHNSQALAVPNSPDAGGISIDFNANGVEVYKNLAYNNNGKGIYIWNANNNKIFYNVIYGNDAGTTVTAAKNSVETAQNNQIYNNTYYKNYNGDGRGPNYNTEIYFGSSGNNNIIKNNILYASNYGYAYLYGSPGATGCVVDYNLVYSESGIVGYDGLKGKQNFAQWRSNHPEWDARSVNADPLFTNAAGYDFTLKANSPAINKGALLGLTSDFMGNSIVGNPDLGACEYFVADNTPPVLTSAELLTPTSIKLTFSEEIQDTGALLVSNYSISGGVTAASAVINSSKTIVTLTTSVHSGGNYTLSASNIKDLAGNTITTASNSKSYSYTPPDTTPPQLLSATAALNGASVKLVFSEKIKDSEALATANYSITGSISISSAQLDTSKTEVTLSTSQHSTGTFTVSAVNIKDLSGNVISSAGNSKSYSYVASEPEQQILLKLLAENGTLVNGAALTVQEGSTGAKVAYCTTTSSAIKVTVKIPSAGKWYAWAKLYYQSTSTQNSFFMKIDNGTNFILGNDDSKFNQWHWDGFRSAAIALGNLTAGDHILTISGREPKETVLIDEIILTNDASFSPGEKSISVSSIQLYAENGELSNGASLKTQTGSTGEKVAYCTTTSSTIKFNVNIPSNGEWYAWAKLYYQSTNTKNSFFIKIDNGTNFILGNDDSKFNQWHWDGHKSVAISLGNLSAGNHILTISGREPKETVMIDEIILTNDANFTPGDISLSVSNILLSAENSELSSGAFFKTQTGSKGVKVAYCTTTSSTIKFTVNIPSSGEWYAWARLYYQSTSTQNSFFLRVNDGTNFILGNDDTKFNQWHWDGHRSAAIPLGNLSAGNHTITISGREPSETVMIDQIILTQEADMVASDNIILAKQDFEPLAEVPSAYGLNQNYPNPFNPSTTIRFTLPVSSQVSLKIYDILGKEVAELIDAQVSAGYHEIKFDAHNLSSGTYIYQLRTNDFTKTLKMQLLK